MTNENGSAQQGAAMVRHAGAGTMVMIIGSPEFCGATEPRNLDDMKFLAETYASIAYCGVTSAAEALGRMMTGRALGIPATQSLMGVFNVDGRPVVAAALMHGICLGRQVCEYFDILPEETDATQATCIVKRLGRPERKFRFTLDQAEAAGLLTRATEEKTKASNWSKWREDMLVARCRAITARRVFPDVVFGLQTKEELESGIAVEDVPPGQRDPNEITAEIIPNPVQAAKRDFAKEAADLKSRAKAAKSRADLRLVLDDINKWDGVEPFRSDVASVYNEAAKALKGQKPATENRVPAEATTPPAVASTPVQVPSGNLFTEQPKS